MCGKGIAQTSKGYKYGSDSKQKLMRCYLWVALASTQDHILKC